MKKCRKGVLQMGFTLSQDGFAIVYVEMSSVASPEAMSMDVDDRRLGGSESARTEHPNQEVVSSRPCVRARSVIHVESGMK